MTRSATTVSKNQQFTVTVSQDAADLFAYDLTVGFDSSSFNLTSATVDARGITDTESGKDSVTAIDTKIGTSPGSEGPTTLVTLTFKAKQAGSTASIGVTSLQTVDSNGTVVTTS